MTLTKYTQDTSVIGALGTTPEDRPGMTDQQLKDKFDENALNIKTFINDTLTEEADAAIADLAGAGRTTETVKGVADLVSTVSEDLGDMDDTVSTPVDLQGKDMVTRVNEVFTSASNGKALIASAITGKNLPTEPTESYQTMADNIGLLGEYLPPKGNALSTYTWKEIDIVSRAGFASEYWAIGDEKDVVINGETLTFQIYGFYHDNKTGGGKAGITFGMKNLMASTRQMNSTDTNAGGWTSCAMRSWTMDTLIGQMPSDLQAVLKSVDKLTSVGSQSATINTTSDKVFLFSEIECFGSVTNSKSGEGSKYDIFTNDTSRIKKLSNGSGSANTWFGRSPRGNDSISFCSVISVGSSAATGAIDSRGVALGFCV